MEESHCNTERLQDITAGHSDRNGSRQPMNTCLYKKSLLHKEGADTCINLSLFSKHLNPAPLP